MSQCAEALSWVRKVEVPRADRPQHFIYEEVAMPIILWLLGVPLTLVLSLWLFNFLGF